jgi:hypothetical protein
MAFFDNFTASIKQKWLQFFQMNHGWIVRHMEVESVYTPDGGRRPPSYLILGVVNALEPKLAQLMLPFSKLNPDADTLIDVLELNFDPDLALGNRIIPTEPESYSNSLIDPPDVVVVVEETIIDTPSPLESEELSDMALDSSTVGFEPDLSDASLELGEMSLDPSMVGFEPDLSDASLNTIAGLTAVPEIGDIYRDSDEMALEQFDNESLTALSAAEAQAFGDLSFDEEMADSTLDLEELPQDLGTVHPAHSQVGDTLPDIWDEETTNRTNEASPDRGGEANHDRGGKNHDRAEEEMESLLEDEEISRLFPNF